MIPSNETTQEAINLSPEEMYALYEFIYDDGPVVAEKIVSKLKFETVEDIREPIRLLVQLKVIKRVPNIQGDMRFTRYAGDGVKVRRKEL